MTLWTAGSAGRRRPAPAPDRRGARRRRRGRAASAGRGSSLLRGDINFIERRGDGAPRLDALVAGAPAVVVDLTGVRYLDSSGLNLLLRQSRAAGERDAGFVVVRGAGALPLFRLEAVGRALRVVGSREAAVAALAER